MLEAALFIAVVVAASFCGSGGYLYLPCWAWSTAWMKH